MVDASVTEPLSRVRPKSVQEHIDERPIWPDGTTLRSTPMTGMQWLIWSLAAAGKFFEGFVVFMTGVALPLFSSEFNLGSTEHGVIGAASLFGILVGAVGLGGMSDQFGNDPQPQPRGKLVLGAFAFQAVGVLAGTAVGSAVLSVLPEISAWRWM